MPSTRTKILLYNPKAVFFDMPLALVGIGSALDAARYDVIIVDGRLDPDPEATLLRHLPEALLLGVTSLTGAPLRDAADMSRMAKAVRPELPVIWGGWHTSLFPLETLQDAPYVDVSV